MFRRVLVACLVVLAPEVSYALQSVRGEIAEVTIYRDQALVTRSIPVEGSPGPAEVLVTELPEMVIPGSLSAESESGGKIHSVTYRTTPIAGDTRPEIKAIDDKIADLERQLKGFQARMELLSVKEGVVTNLQEFTAATAQMELQSGVLKFEELEQLAEYALGKHDAFLQERLELQKSVEDTSKQMELENRRRAELAAGYSQMQREALVYLTKETDQPLKVNLRYLVNQVGWQPQYNLRSDDKRDSVTVEYNAIVRQMSGEDWVTDRLALSTAQPMYAAEPPVIASLEVALGPREPVAPEQAQEELDRFRQERGKAQKEIALKPEMSLSLNTIAGREQMLQMAQPAPQAMAQSRRKPGRVEGVSVTYALPYKVSLASRADEQVLQIATGTVPARFTHIAVPALTDFVYEEAQAKNDTPYILLPGAYDAYLGGKFVGRGKIGLIACGEDFTAGFGVNPQVQVAKELVVKTESVEGGNAVSEFEYRLTISSYSDRPVALRLEDRIPYSRDGSVQVKLVDAQPEVCQDEEYRETKLGTGLLLWNLEIPAQAVNDKALVVTYRFRMAHDKEMGVRGLFEPGEGQSVQ